jgi:transposase InsO family protein
VIDEIDDEMLAKDQKSDATLSYIYENDLGKINTHVKNMHEKRTLEMNDFFETKDGVLYTVDNSPKNRGNLRLVVPKHLRRKLLSEIHDGLMSAHPGIGHMYRKISDIAWWPHWRSDIIRYVLECEKCQRVKRRKMIDQLPRPVSVPDRPFQHIGVDIVGPFPTSQQGNVYILTVVDHFTRWAEAIPLQEATTKTIASALITHVICRHGLFDTMTSDNGSNFVSELANYIYKELGIKRLRTTPEHPQSNGVPERFNGTLKSVLKLWCNEEQDNWDVYLPYALFAYNTSFHALIQETPFFLVHGRDPKLLVDIIINKKDDYYVDQHGYGEMLVRRLREVFERVRKIYEDINNKRIEAIESVEETHYAVGDKVLLYDSTTKIGLSRKLTVRWKGPYTIMEKINDINYIININGKMLKVNKQRLRPYHSSTTVVEEIVLQHSKLSKN